MINTFKNVDVLNTILIVLSLVLSFLFPFELFLIVYAILGPLHYLTEINWIKDNNYFVLYKRWVFLPITIAFLISVPIVLNLPIFESISNSIILYLKNLISTYSNVLIFLALILAYSFLFIKQWQIRFLIGALAFILSIFLNDISGFNIWIGIFLPTIIHVYVFTLLFMWYGNLKTNSKIGQLNVVLLVFVPVIISLLNIDFRAYDFSLSIKNIIIENRFHILNVNISKVLGLSDGTDFFFYEKIDLKVQIMIAFAYTYHYLNWFSKTTVIGWHKKITKKKSLIIISLWLCSVCLYFYDYKIGLAILLFLSLLHVFMEFPLNIISIKAIGRHLLGVLNRT